MEAEMTRSNKPPKKRVAAQKRKPARRGARAATPASLPPAGCTPGDWVALDKRTQRRVLAEAPDIGALIDLVEQKGLVGKVFLTWVPDPSVTYVF